MLGVLPFVEDPDLSVSAARALAQHLPPWPWGHGHGHGLGQTSLFLVLGWDDWTVHLINNSLEINILKDLKAVGIILIAMH